ncbi:hypothetical protein T439DRAFT_327615 [Meredithblackwellia eburnea MCA 4105]
MSTQSGRSTPEATTPSTIALLHKSTLQLSLLDATELRWALVLYGGVSLAIYMHGVTKELHKVVRASKVLDRYYELQVNKLETDTDKPVAQSDPTKDHDAFETKAKEWCSKNGPIIVPGKWDTEDTYISVLLKLAGASRRRLTVSIDIVGATSAGGVNGVCLGSALSHNRSQDNIREMWINEGGFNQLTNLPGPIEKGDGYIPSFLALFMSGVRLLFNHTKALLDGDDYAKKLHAAFLAMETNNKAVLAKTASTTFSPKTGPAKSLIREGGTLDLYTTATDLRGTQENASLSPSGSVNLDATYRQALHFQYGGATDSFAGVDVPGFTGISSAGPLGFAARATSSFPGAFEPVSVTSYAEATGLTVNSEVDQVPLEFLYDIPGHGVKDAYFVDGGVLDNYPFDLVISSISEKVASGETVRDIVYLEPHPATTAPNSTSHTLKNILTSLTAKHGTPTWWESVKSSLFVIPAHISIVEPLRQLAEANASIASLGSFIEELLKAPPEKTELSKSALKLYIKLCTIAEANLLAKSCISAIGFPQKSSEASFIRQVFTSVYAMKTGMQVKDLLSYQLRSAEYAINQSSDRLHKSETPTERRNCKFEKGRNWTHLHELQVHIAQLGKIAIEKNKDFIELITSSAMLKGPDLFIADTKNLAVVDKITSLFYPATIDPNLPWTAEAKQNLEKFQELDKEIFPTLALAHLPQLRTIGVVRFSPDDATMLTPRDADGHPRSPGQTELDGTTWRNFGAFFSKASREHDYLWGRLDGVEMVAKLLTSRAQVKDGDVRLGTSVASDIVAGFGKILRTESDLSEVKGMIKVLDGNVKDAQPYGIIRDGGRLEAWLKKPAKL